MSWWEVAREECFNGPVAHEQANRSDSGEAELLLVRSGRLLRCAVNEGEAVMERAALGQDEITSEGVLANGGGDGKESVVDRQSAGLCGSVVLGRGGTGGELLAEW